VRRACGAPVIAAPVRRIISFARSPVLIYLSSSLLSKVGLLFLLPLYTRRLSVEQYGDYVLTQLLVSLLPPFLSLSLASAVARFLFDGTDRSRGEARAGAAAVWLVCISVGTALLLQAFLLALAPAGGSGISGRWELTCVLWAAVGGAIGAVPFVYFRARQRAFAAASFQLAQFTFLIAAGLLLVGVFDRGLRGAIEATAVALVLHGVMGAVFIFSRFGIRADGAVLREAVRFAAPFMPHLAANQAKQMSDRWVLKAAGFQTGLGFYSLAVQITMPVSMVVAAWNDSKSPQMGEVFRSHGLVGLAREHRALQMSYVRAAALPAIALLLALPAVAWLIGNDFAPALKFVPLFLAIAFVDAFYYPNILVLFYADCTSRIPVITLRSGLLNVALNILLIPVFGLGGAVFASAAAALYRSYACWREARSILTVAKKSPKAWGGDAAADEQAGAPTAEGFGSR
jgi:O-antigen/teichoic acid export membrane protein